MFFKYHRRLALTAAKSYRVVALSGDIKVCSIVCNRVQALTNNSARCRYLSSTNQSRESEDDSKESRINNGNNHVEQNTFYGGSNFQQMLRYQNMTNHTTSRDHHKKKTSSKKQEQLVNVHKQTQTIRHRQQSKNNSSSNNRMRPRQTLSRKVGKQRDGINQKAAGNTKLEKSTQSMKVASSDWILISNIPPMSKLSDVIAELEKIVSFEMRKGVIDLDRIEEYVNSDVNSQQRRENLDSIGARESFYSTQQVDVSSGIPLWTHDNEDELPSHMVLEARLHLSQHARPKGWFLRLPSSSIVHAVLNHIKEAEKVEKIERKRAKAEENVTKSERRKWRQGLWKGVWSEHENRVVSSENIKLLANEKEEDWSLAFDVGSDERLRIHHEEKTASADIVTATDVDCVSPVDDGIEVETMPSEEDPHTVAFAYLDEYAQSHPYPEQFQSERNDDVASSGYRSLMCGSTQLKVDEFHPDSHTNRLHSWEQASFQMSPVLNLSDSVVRIETEALGKSVDDIQYLFRGYDLEGILPERVGCHSALPKACTEYVKSLGWNTKGEGSNVDILIDGRAKSANPRHTFLVRFASASSARMAVRDELRFRHGNDSLTMAQFPQSTM